MWHVQSKQASKQEAAANKQKVMHNVERSYRPFITKKAFSFPSKIGTSQ